MCVRNKRGAFFSPWGAFEQQRLRQPTPVILKPSRILRILAASLGLIVIVGLTAWAFMAYLHPDRVGDFASFITLCTSALIR